MDKNKFMLLIDDICDVEPGTIQENNSINDSGIFDSIAILGLVAMLDKSFGLSFSMDELKELDTIANLFDKITAQLSK